jgi:hypothetical protein
MNVKRAFTKRRVVIGVAAALAVAGAGGAVAATQLDSPREESQAVLDDAAEELGIQPSELSDALKKGLSNRIDEAVEDGRLSEEEGKALKERINSGDFPLFGVPHHRFFAPFKHGFGPMEGPKHDLSDAASYLGLTEAQLREQLNDGKTLGQIARNRDKSVDGLVDRLVAEKKERIEAAVDDDRLTRAQADELLGGLEKRTRDFVENGRLQFKFHEDGPGPRFDREGKPGFPDDASSLIVPPVY